MTWVEPDEFHHAPGPDGADVVIYRAYKDGEYSRPLQFWFSTSAVDDEDTFDVRDLAVVQNGEGGFRDAVRGGNDAAIREALTLAIAAGALRNGE